MVGSAPRTDDRGETVPDAPPRPAYASGQLNLSIPPLQRTLALQVTPAETELEPGGETTVDVIVKDAAGNPVPDSEVAVVVVDEAILALSSYQLTDPLSVFYADRPSDLASQYGRTSIVLVDPRALALDDQAVDLKGRSYGVIALGDSGYQYFAQAGLQMENALYMTGAKRIGEICTLDAKKVSNHPLAAAQWATEWVTGLAG